MLWYSGGTIDVRGLTSGVARECTALLRARQIVRRDNGALLYPALAA